MDSVGPKQGIDSVSPKILNITKTYLDRYVNLFLLTDVWFMCRLFSPMK